MKQVFDMAPATGAANGMIVAIGILFLVIFLVLASSRMVHFEVSPDGSKIAGSIYGRTIPLQQLAIEEARVIDLTTDTEHKLSWRTNGIGLPGYSAGWFKLKNGDKALAFVTSKQVAFVPSREGYTVLLSAKSPGELVEALKAAAGRR